VIFFITGATGFLGGHLADTLNSQGHTVYSLARSSKKVEEFNIKGEVIYGDLSLKSIKSWITKLPEHIDHVIHTAGIVHSYKSQDFFDINTQSTIHLFDELTKRYTHGHFIFISSLAAAGPGSRDKLPNELDQTMPVSSYGKSKQNAEEKLLKSEVINWRVNVIRPPMVIGPRDPAILDIFKMVTSKIVLYPGLGAGKKEYSFVCVFDLVDAIVKLSEVSSLSKEIFYVSNPNIITYETLIQTIKAECQSNIIIASVPFIFIKIIAKVLSLVNYIIPMSARLTPDKINELEPMNWTCDSQKSEQLLGMKYKWELGETITKTKTDYQERGWI
jgi:nucleoside-diphosphate-sugar epimerase